MLVPTRVPFEVWKVIGIDKQVPQCAPLKCPPGPVKQVDMGVLQHCRDGLTVDGVLASS